MNKSTKMNRMTEKVLREVIYNTGGEYYTGFAGSPDDVRFTMEELYKFVNVIQQMSYETGFADGHNAGYDDGIHDGYSDGYDSGVLSTEYRRSIGL